MNCAEIDILLCDYVDGTLDGAVNSRVEEHLAGCAACAELARDSAAAAAFLETVEPVEAPQALVTRILRQSPQAHAAPAQRETLPWWRRLFEPILQPRLAMGMAMTILSFSMIARFAGIEQRPLTAADLDPVKIWSSIDTKVHRAYDRALKYYENMRLVYAIQNRLREWSAEEEDQKRPRMEPVDLERPSEPDSEPGNGNQGERR